MSKNTYRVRRVAGPRNEDFISMSPFGKSPVPILGFENIYCRAGRRLFHPFVLALATRSYSYSGSGALGTP